MYSQEIQAIEKFMTENPTEALSVMRAVITLLLRNEREEAEYKIELDSDKFDNREKVLGFFDSIGLLSVPYRARLIRWGYNFPGSEV